MHCPVLTVPWSRSILNLHKALRRVLQSENYNEIFVKKTRWNYEEKHEVPTPEGRCETAIVFAAAPIGFFPLPSPMRRDVRRIEQRGYKRRSVATGTCAHSRLAPGHAYEFIARLPAVWEK
jgi:hypothetical protein